MSELTEYLDRLEDVAGEIAKLAKAVTRQEAPKVDVHVPATPRAEPVINLPALVSHVHVERPTADYEVTDIQRNNSGLLTGFKIKTISK